MRKLKPPKDPRGYTREEIMEQMSPAEFKHFSKMFGSQTGILTEQGVFLFFPWDVERAMNGLEPLD